MTTNTYTVMMHREIADTLDYSLSPMDGIVAIGQVHTELPLFHRPSRSKSPRNHLRLHHFRLGWAGLGLSYIELHNRLQVLEVWQDDGRCARELPMSDDEDAYVKISDGPAIDETE
jgi:hypothetical protein